MKTPSSAAFALLALSGPALAQAQGAYPAVLFCEASSARSPSRETLTVEIESGRASYAVAMGSPKGAETGRGTLAGRRLSLTGTGRGAGFSYTSRYAGDVGGRGGTLTGAQSGTLAGKPFNRSCQLVLGDGRS